MTTIIAVNTKDAIYFAADGRTSSEYDILAHNAKKIIPIAQGAIAFTGPARLGLVFKEKLADKKFESAEDLVQQFCVQLEGERWMKPEEAWGAVLAFKGELFSIDPSRYRVSGKVIAAGTGRDLVKGACEAMLYFTEPSETMLRDCVRIACKWDAGSGGKITSYTVKK